MLILQHPASADLRQEIFVKGSSEQSVYSGECMKSRLFSAITIIALTFFSLVPHCRHSKTNSRPLTLSSVTLIPVTLTPV